MTNQPSGDVVVVGAGMVGAAVEFEPKGGLVVASTPESLTALTHLAAGQRAAGVTTVAVDAADSTTWSRTWRPDSRAACSTRRTPRPYLPWPPPICYERQERAWRRAGR